MQGPPRLEPDTVVHDRYRVVRPVGQGGMGTVYEAVDLRLGHRVALKQMLLEGEVADRAFEREARLLAGLRHSALPAVSDFFSEAQGRFLVQQFIPGQTIADLARERGRPFPVAEVLRWADHLLRVLEYLHGRTPPVLHRDIKPANLKLTGDGEVVLLDFGLAKGMGETTSTGPTVHGLTPQYAPIEQFYGSGTDARSDLFALGGTLYALLGGTPPVDALTRASSLGSGKPDPLRPLADLNSEVPPRIGAWVMKALAVHQEDRPPSAAAMRHELVDILGDLTAEEPPTLPLSGHDPTVSQHRVPRRRDAMEGRRSRALLWLAGAAAAVVALVFAGRLLVRSPSDGASPSITTVEGEGFEFRWAADDHWKLSEGAEQRAVKRGTGGDRVPPGRYRIEPLSDAVFEPVEFTVEAGRKTVVAPPSGSFEFQWAGEDYWSLKRGDKQVAVHKETATRVVSPGRYRVEPMSDAVFEPVEFTVEAGKKAVVSAPSGSFEFQWAGEDYWSLKRGGKQVAVHKETATRVVSPGRYRVEPVSDAVFEPVELTVEAGKKAVVSAPSGSFEFQWGADDYWRVERAGKQVAIHHGTATRVVSPGRYRIVSHSDAVFEPVEFTVEAGQKTVISAPSGSFEFPWAGEDHWRVERAGKQVAFHQGTATREVSPGRYRIVPHSDAVFEPVEFTVEAGRKTVVPAPSGSFEFRWPGEGYWRVERGGKPVALHQGTATRLVSPGRYRIVPHGDKAFAPVEFTVQEGRTTTVKPK